MNKEKYEPIIGLEIHVELATKSKMFCGCPADWFGKPPNSICCPVCLGLPGALPVPNRKAVEWCVMLGLALNCEIPLFSKFDRKNYFYPDLPKGYQISQYDQPFARSGELKIKVKSEKLKVSEEKIVRIRRVHLEEDTGKLIHATVEGKKCTLIDINRSGVALVEIVTEPDIRGSEEARTFLKKLYQIIKYLGISDADMEKGSMRLEPNISVRILRHSGKSRLNRDASRIPLGSWTSQDDDLPPYKVEVKNINSFSFAKKAIDFEIDRHIEILNRGQEPTQETRGWDEKKGITYSQRSKEDAQDYRYFPEPDIPPIHWTGNQISNIKNQIGELPDAKLNRFISGYGLSEYDAAILTDDKKTAEYFEQTINIKHITYNKEQISPKMIANWIINKKIDINKVSPEESIKLIFQNQRVTSMDEKELEIIIKQVISGNLKAVDDYKKGKQSSIMFLVGQVMRELKGKADPQTIRNILEKRLQ